MKKKSKNVGIGSRVLLTEAVIVYDDLGHELLLAGTDGTIAGIENDTLSLRTAKGLFYGIPIKSTRPKMEGKAA